MRPQITATSLHPMYISSRTNRQNNSGLTASSIYTNTGVTFTMLSPWQASTSVHQVPLMNADPPPGNRRHTKPTNIAVVHIYHHHLVLLGTKTDTCFTVPVPYSIQG